MAPFSPSIAPRRELLEATRGRVFRAKVYVFEDELKTKPLEGLGTEWIPSLTLQGWKTLAVGSGLQVAVGGLITVVLTPTETTAAPAPQLRYSLDLEEAGKPTELHCLARGAFAFVAP